MNGNCDKQWEEWQVGKTITEANSYMLKYEVATDVTFHVGSNKEPVRAHKYMLMSRSCVLQDALAPYMETIDVTVSIPDVKVDVFRDVLMYMYTDHIDLHESNVTSVLYVAKKFALHGLTSLCFKYLDSIISPTNVCKILEQAHTHQQTSLRDKCVEYCHSNGTDILKTPGFSDLCRECVSEIISSDDLKADEELIYEAMVSWATQMCRTERIPATDPNRRQVLGDLLYEIRFPIMDVVYFTQKVSFREILSNDEAVSIFQYFHGEEQKLSIKFKRSERNRLVAKRSVGEKRSQPRNNVIQPIPRGTVRVAPTKRVSDTPIVLDAPKSPNMSKISRFRTYDGEWRQNGPPDAISFSCSSPVVLYGIEVFGSSKGVETYTLKIYLFDDLKEEVRKNEATITTDTIRRTYDVMLTRPVRIPPRRVFTVVVVMKGSPTCKGVDGTSVHVSDGVTFEFFNSNRSSNGTDVTVGQIPSLLFNKTD